MKLFRLTIVLLFTVLLTACQTSSGQNVTTELGKNLGKEKWREISAIESRFQVKLEPGEIQTWEAHELSGRRQERVRTKLGIVFYEYYFGLGGFTDPGDPSDFEKVLSNRSSEDLQFTGGKKERIKSGVKLSLFARAKYFKCSYTVVFLNEPGSNEWASRSEQFYQANIQVISCSEDMNEDEASVRNTNKALFDALILDGGPRNRAGT